MRQILMNRLHIITVVFAALFIASCSAPEYRRKLIEADSIASAAPEMLMQMLDSMKHEMSSAPEHEQMFYHLLCIKASDKAYIKHTSDSTILQLIKYYEKKGDNNLLSEAYY